MLPHLLVKYKTTGTSSRCNTAFSNLEPWTVPPPRGGGTEPASERMERGLPAYAGSLRDSRGRSKK